MTTKFPAALDDATTLPAAPSAVPLGSTLNAIKHSVYHQNLTDAAKALEKLALSPAAANVRGYGAVGDGVADDLGAFNAAAAVASAPAGGGVILVPPGLYALSATFTLPPNVALIGAGGPVTIDASANLTELPVRSWIVALAGFSVDRLVQTGKHSSLAFVGLNAGTLAAYTCVVGGADLTMVGCSIFGGTTWGLYDSGPGARTTVLACSFNNLANAGTGGGTFCAGGPDWIVTGCRKKSGTAQLGSAGQVITGCHLTGGSPNLAVTAPGRITGSYIDSTFDASAALVVDSRTGTNTSPFVFSATKFYQASPATNVAMIQRTGAAPAPMTVDGACSVEAVTGCYFTFLVDYTLAAGAADVVADNIQINQFALNGATPTLYNGGLPAYQGALRYLGFAYPALRGEVELGVEAALTSAVSNVLLTTTTLQPGTYEMVGQVTIANATVGGTVDLGFTHTGTMTGFKAVSGRITGSAANVIAVICQVVVTVAGTVSLCVYPGAAVADAAAKVAGNVAGSSYPGAGTSLQWRRKGA